MQENVSRSKKWIGFLIFCIVMGLFILIPVTGYYVIQSGLKGMYTWETGCAVEYSIAQFYLKHDRFPENWEEIIASYLENDRVGHGAEPEVLPEYIDVNFEFLRQCNQGEREQAIAAEQPPWIVTKTGNRGKRSHEFEKEFYDRIMDRCREQHIDISNEEQLPTQQQGSTE